MTDMQQDQTPDQPLYWDNDRTSMNITLVLAMIIAIYGLYSQQLVMGMAGLAIAAYTWLTRPRRYLIYSTRLVIQYGQPRIKIIPFEQISHLEMLTLGVGGRIRVVMQNGRRIMVMARDLDTFHEQLDAALETFQGGASESSEDRPAIGRRVIDHDPEASESPEGDTPAGDTFNTAPDVTLDPDAPPPFDGPRPG